VKLSDIYKPPAFTGEPCFIALKRIRAAMEEDQVNMDPPYQRGLKWSRAQQEAYMGHLITGGLVLPVIVQRKAHTVNGAEMLDGKQRIHAMYRWLDGEIGAEIEPGRVVFVDEIDDLRLLFVTVRYIDLPFKQRKEFYVKLNDGGVRHTAEELEAARNAEEDPS
jgi:hypothetical protein